MRKNNSEGEVSDIQSFNFFDSEIGSSEENDIQIKSQGSQKNERFNILSRSNNEEEKEDKNSQDVIMNNEENAISILRCDKVVKDEFEYFISESDFYLTFSTNVNCYLIGFGILKGVQAQQQYYIIYQKVVQENSFNGEEERICFEDSDMYETQQKYNNCGELHIQKLKHPVQIQAQLQYSLVLLIVGQPTHIGLQSSFKQVVSAQGLTVTFKDVQRSQNFHSLQQSTTNGNVLNLMFKMEI